MGRVSSQSWVRNELVNVPLILLRTIVHWFCKTKRLKAFIFKLPSFFICRKFLYMPRLSDKCLLDSAKHVFIWLLSRFVQMSTYCCSYSQIEMTIVKSDANLSWSEIKFPRQRMFFILFVEWSVYFHHCIKAVNNNSEMLLKRSFELHVNKLSANTNCLEQLLPFLSSYVKP